MLRLEVEGRGCVVIHRRVLLLHHCVALCVCREIDLCLDLCACNSGGSRSNRKRNDLIPNNFQKRGKGCHCRRRIPVVAVALVVEIYVRAGQKNVVQKMCTGITSDRHTDKRTYRAFMLYS